MTIWRRIVDPVIALIVVCSVVLLGGCAGKAVNGRGCAISTKLVPSCGILLGIATEPPTNAQLANVEATLNTRFAMVHRFHDLDDPVPTDDERALVAQGRVLQLSLDPRFFSRPDQTVTWNDIASGRYDPQLSAQARGVASLRSPVFVTFAHEPDVPGRTALGSPAEFVAAWRHVYGLFAQQGATNAVWAWVVTGSPDTERTAVQMWPGNAYVDWISWESYNASGCRADATNPNLYKSFAATTLPFLHYLDEVHKQYDIDLGKPMMISEAGSVLYANRPQLTAGWYKQIPAVLRAHPQIKALGLWDHSGRASCAYRFDDVPMVAGAVRHVATSEQITG